MDANKEDNSIIELQDEQQELANSDLEIFGPSLSPYINQDLVDHTYKYLNKIISERGTNYALGQLNMLQYQQGDRRYKHTHYASHEGLRAPEHLLRDIFSLYYTPGDNFRIEIPDDDYHWRKYDLLSLFNNIYMRAATEGRMSFSFISYAEIVFYLENKIAENILQDMPQDGQGCQGQEDQEGQQGQQGQGQGQSNGTSGGNASGNAGSGQDEQSGEGQQGGSQGQSGPSSSGQGEPQQESGQDQGGSDDGQESQGSDGGDQGQGSDGSSDGSDNKEQEGQGDQGSSDEDQDPGNDTEDPLSDAPSDHGHSAVQTQRKTEEELSEHEAQKEREKRQFNRIKEEVTNKELREIFDHIGEKIEDVRQAEEMGLDSQVRDRIDMSQIGKSTQENSVGWDHSSSPVQRAMNGLENLKLMGNVNMRRKTVDDFIKSSFRASKAYFSSQYDKVNESILDSDALDEIHGLEYLHPAFQKLKIPDITNKKKQYRLSFDVMIDCSGSMEGGGISLGDGHVGPLILSQLTAAKIMRMGYVREVRFFNEHISEPTDDVVRVMTVMSSGGTNIERVLRFIESRKRPTLIITDMGSPYSTYTKNAFFIGINGAYFGGGDPDVVKKYREKGQFMYFDDQQQRFIKG